MAVNANNVKAFRGDLEAALSLLEEQYGVKIKVGTIRYNPEQVSCKIIGTTLTEARTEAAAELGEEVTPELAALWAQSDILFGEYVDTTATHVVGELGRCKLVGYKTRNRQYPIIVRQVLTGNRYKISLEQARRYWK